LPLRALGAEEGQASESGCPDYATMALSFQNGINRRKMDKLDNNSISDKYLQT